MSRTNTATVCLATQWNDWHSANAPLDALRAIHWHRPAGAPQPMVHAYIWCADIVGGALSHRCSPVSAPHEVLVCVLRRHNLPSTYAQLVRQADQARNPR